MIAADPLFYAVALGAGIALAALTAWRPWAGIAAACLLLPMHLLVVAILDHTVLGLPAHSVPDVVQALNRQYALDAALVAGLVVGAAARLLVDRRLPARAAPPLVWFAALYTIAVGVLVVTSSPSRPSLYAFVVGVAGPVTLLAVWATGPHRRTPWIVGCALTAALGVAIAAIVEQRFGTAVPVWLRGGPPPAPASSYFTNGDTGYRSGSVLGSTLELGFYLGAALPAAVAVAIAGRRGLRIAAIAAAPILAVGLGLSFTRSGWIGAGVGIVIVGVLLPRRRAVRMGVVAAVLTAGAVVGVAAVDHGLGDRLLRAGSDQGHADHVREDLRLIADRPLGHGLGVIDAIGQNFDRGAIADQASEDEYLAKGVEGGIPELALYATGTLLLLGSLTVAWRRAQGDPFTAALAVGALGSASALAVASLLLGIEVPTFTVPVWAAVGLVLGRVAAPSRRGRRTAALDPEVCLVYKHVPDHADRPPELHPTGRAGATDPAAPPGPRHP